MTQISLIDKINCDKVRPDDLLQIILNNNFNMNEVLNQTYTNSIVTPLSALIVRIYNRTINASYWDKINNKGLSLVAIELINSGKAGDINIKLNNYGSTPLIMSLSLGIFDVAETLIDNGATISNFYNGENAFDTLLDELNVNGPNKHIENLVKKIIEYGM